MVVKNKKVKLKGEKILWILIVLFVIAIPFARVYTQAKLSESNIEVEMIKRKIEEQSNINESLSMKINELASLDKIREVASNEGLSYNNDNIKVIEDNE